jgi:hypothetical protein
MVFTGSKHSQLKEIEVSEITEQTAVPNNTLCFLAPLISACLTNLSTKFDLNVLSPVYLATECADRRVKTLRQSSAIQFSGGMRAVRDCRVQSSCPDARRRQPYSESR